MTVEPIEVHVIHRYAASPQRIFDAFLDPEMLGRFMFGPVVRDEEIVRLEMNANVGGGDFRSSFAVTANSSITSASIWKSTGHGSWRSRGASPAFQ